MDEIMNDPSLKELDNSFKNMETPTDAKMVDILQSETLNFAELHVW